MIKRFLAIIIFIASTGGYISAQKEGAAKLWSLEDCILHAVEHNLNIKQIQQDIENKEVELSTSKNSRLPNLNVSASQNFNFGRSPSTTGVIVDRNSSNSSLNVQTSMPIFDGFRITNDIEVKKLNLSAALKSMEKARENLSVNVASLYVQVLYYKELRNISQLQYDLTTSQVERTEALVNSGKAPESQLYDIKAQQASDEVSLIEAKNNESLYLLDLAQNLELEREEMNFDVVVPSSQDIVVDNMKSIIPPDNIYENAVSFKPQIKEQEILLESRKKMLNVARAGYYPTLNFGASLSTGYYHYYNQNVENASFENQLNQNLSRSIGLTLSIPVFNRFQVRNSVRSARIGIFSQEISILNSKKELYKEIQQAYYNAIASQEKYISSNKSVDAARESYKYSEERYNAGKSTVFEYNEAKTKYSQSLSQQAQAKYDYIFRVKILDFYNGVELKL
jgi:outer membrane protein